MADMSGSTRFRALFESALQVYEKKTGITLAIHPLAVQLQSCHSVEAITSLVEDQASTFGDIREKSRIVRSVRCTIPILATLSANAALDDAINLLFPPAKAIHTGLAILLATARGVRSSYDALADLLESVEHFVQCLDIYGHIPHTPALGEMVVQILMELLFTFALATNKLKQGRSPRFVKNRFGEENIDEVLQRLQQLTKDEARETAVENLTVVHGLIQNINVVMDDDKLSVDDSQEALQIPHKMTSNKNKTKREKLRRHIQNWLSPPDPRKNHRIACESHHTGTAAWFIQGETFLEWKESRSSSLLWLHGKPGAGKSVLCSTIIEEIEAMAKSGLASLAFYYYDFRDDQKKDLRGLLSSVLFQLYDQSHSYQDILSAFFSTHRHGAQSPSDDDLVRCLRDMLELPGQAPVYLIVDALDECPSVSALTSPREKVLELVEDLVDSKIPNLRICVTSRPVTEIKVVLQPLTLHSVSIHDETGQIEDIENYIKSSVNTNRKMQRWTLEHKQRVIDELTGRADGMFRWVYCQLDYLADCLPGRVLHALNELPETLDETYERTLREIKSSNWEFARRLFLCVTAAARPLRFEELAEFLAFDFKAGPIPEFREDWRLEDPLEAVLSTCSTLLAHVNDDPPVIQFSHFSVKEFLTSSRFADKSDTISRRYHISTTPAHALLAQACLGILLHLDKDVTKDSLKQFPLAKYAAEHWVEHARFEGVLQQVQEGMEQLFDARKPHHLAVWVWIRDPRIPSKRAERPVPLLGTPLHFAAFCGLHPVVKFLAIENPGDVHSRFFYPSSTPLHVASRRGHVEVTRLLIEHGAEVTAIDDNERTPLHEALQEGSTELVCLLIEHGADVTAQDDRGWTPLHIAVKNGRVDLTRLLINHGADTQPQDREGWTPLHEAVCAGSDVLARLLVNHGAGVSIQNNDDSTPLHMAVEKGSVDLIRLCVEHGADMTAQDKDGRTPLHMVVRDGRIDLARLLVEHGANATAQDKEGSTPLHLAIQAGNVDLSRLLIEHGGDAAAQKKDGSTPLHLAVYAGRVDLARLLVDHGANVQSPKKDGSTPLSLAVGAGSVDLVCLLVERGADTTACDEHGLTPLHMAVKDGRMDLTRLLAGRSRDVTVPDKEGLTPLHMAVRDGRADLTRLLIELDADATAEDEGGLTPLHMAVQVESVDLAHLLVDCGADLTARSIDGSTPLHLAVLAGNVDLSGFLLDRGANVAAKKKDGSTPLHLVVQTRSVDLALLLVEHGANLTAKKKDGSTPLHMAVRNGSADLARFLVERGAEMATQENDGWTPLHFAVQAGDEDLVRLLVQHDADVTSKNNDGSTPLHIAAQNGNAVVTRLLLERGADATAQDKDGRSPSQMATMVGKIDLARLLDEYCADVTDKDSHGSDTLHVENKSETLHVEKSHQPRPGLLRRVMHRLLKAWR